MTEIDRTFRAMGCDVRIVLDARGADPVAALDAAEAFVHDADATLSRFKPASELCALNADPRPTVPASPLLREAVHAGAWAASLTGGLVDPTLTGALEAAGYAASREGAPRLDLRHALPEAPPRRRARPHPGAAWRAIAVDDAAGTVTRPPGLRLDTGGTGKGLVADLVAERLAGRYRFAVDCGGDVRIGGPQALARPYPVDVLHPLTGGVAWTVPVGRGGIATSGLDVRLWRRDDGRIAHHLLDPSTGEPAWTGLVGVTALGSSALHAEVLAKAALLSGPEGARRVLAGLGGLLVHEDGAVEAVGPLRPRPALRFGALETVA